MIMINRVSVVFTAALALTSVIANPVPSSHDEPGVELEARGSWHYPKTHRVTVGAGGQLRYNPEYVSAGVGDYIKFEFHPKNHTVTESSFNQPCNRIDGGFRTGFVPVPPDTKAHFPTKVFKVTDNKPHWFYCGQIDHCPAGMVFAVNPPHKGNTFHKFKETARYSGK
ncbi:putative plastocyanin-like domain protein [Rhizoctonia solani 123E]|uniref:Putative plastocyanin-like domain protein n=1 Tax=Rhizoctonia solani 123E TaxID=1423351 RepID=A0A074RQ06_9AGAM|nr:putative plastocyanin-like domain protein [Rhizoctonia solani 123E]